MADCAGTALFSAISAADWKNRYNTKQEQSMKDNFGREINYLRISVTDRCNLRCRYCMPESGFQNIIPKEQILSFEEIVRLAQAAAKMGISKVRSPRRASGTSRNRGFDR